MANANNPLSKIIYAYYDKVSVTTVGNYKKMIVAVIMLFILTIHMTVRVCM